MKSFPDEKHIDGRNRHEGFREGRQAGIHGDQGVPLPSREGQVLGIAECLPILLTRDPPRDPPRYTITEESHFYLRDPFVRAERVPLSPLASPHIVEQDLQGLTADRVGSDQLVALMHMKPAVHQVQKSGRIYDIAAHQQIPSFSPT